MPDFTSLGVAVGHTGRGRGVVVAVAGAARAVPTLGLLTVLGLVLGIGPMAPVLALVVLAVPSLLAGCYAGVQAVDSHTVDAARAIGREVAAGRLNPDKIDERVFARHLYVPELPDADLVWRTSGEQRLSNYMLWQAAYSEMVFTDVLWPDVDRRHLWAAIETYAGRDRRYGGAMPNFGQA